MRIFILSLFYVLGHGPASAQDPGYKDAIVEVGRFVYGHPYGNSCRIVVADDESLDLSFDHSQTSQNFPYRVTVSRSNKADGSNPDKRFSINNLSCPDGEFTANYPIGHPFVFHNTTGGTVVFFLFFEDADEQDCDALRQFWGPQKVTVRNNSGGDYDIIGTSALHPLSSISVNVRVY